jgi:hypothetical protein
MLNTLAYFKVDLPIVVEANAHFFGTARRDCESIPVWMRIPIEKRIDVPPPDDTEALAFKKGDRLDITSFSGKTWTARNDLSVVGSAS